jgi:hypothetical protein
MTTKRKNNDNTPEQKRQQRAKSNRNGRNGGGERLRQKTDPYTSKVGHPKDERRSRSLTHPRFARMGSG